MTDADGLMRNLGLGEDGYVPGQTPRTYAQGWNDATAAIANEYDRLLDLTCDHYVGSDHRPTTDGCPANGRRRDGQYASERWCLPCEVRARLASASGCDRLLSQRDATVGP